MHTPHVNNNLNNSKSTPTSLNAPNGTADANAGLEGLEDEGGGDGEPANPADKPSHSQSEYQSHYQALLNNTVTYNAQGQPGPSPDPDIIYANATKLVPPRSQQTQTQTQAQAALGLARPASPAIPYGAVSGAAYGASAQLKSPKSPRPQISVDITPATPRSGITASSTFGSIPPSAATTTSQPPQKQPLSGPPSVASKPTQSQVQSRPSAGAPGSGLSSPHEAVQNWVQSQATSPTTPHSPHTHMSTSHPASPHKPDPSKRNSLSAIPADKQAGTNADKHTDSRGRRPSNASQRSQPHDHPRPPSVAGSTSGGEGHGKFSLRDLLSSGPKLSRKNSASSKKTRFLRGVQK